MKTSSLITELVGPAGAGKTTFMQALKQRSNRIQTSALPDSRSIKGIPFFARNTLSLLPILICLYRNNDGRWPVPRDIARMVILEGWHRELGRQASNNNLIVLDQGPVYILAGLCSLGSENLKSQSAKKWRDRMYKQYADTLDVVIWLDTCDTTLIERIHARHKEHVVKNISISEGIDFLARCRLAFEEVLSVLTAESRDLKVLHFDTAESSPDEIVDSVLVLLGITSCEEETFTESPEDPHHSNHKASPEPALGDHRP